jgi:hypothetical protein
VRPRPGPGRRSSHRRDVRQRCARPRAADDLRARRGPLAYRPARPAHRRSAGGRHDDPRSAPRAAMSARAQQRLAPQRLTRARVCCAPTPRPASTAAAASTSLSVARHSSDSGSSAASARSERAVLATLRAVLRLRETPGAQVARGGAAASRQSGGGAARIREAGTASFQATASFFRPGAPFRAWPSPSPDCDAS